MVKKIFTKSLQQKLNNLSDIELIEDIDNDSAAVSGEAHRTIIRAILDKRLKKSIHNLTEVIQNSNKKTTKQTNWLIGLTIVIAILTFLMLIGVGVQIFKNLKINL